MMLTFVLLASLLPAQDYDLLIRNGRIVDGTGNPSYLADVAITGQRIVAMGKLPGKTAKRVIDAQGHIVAPGFIDIHNHSDNTVLVDGNAQSGVRQGITTMIFGEGGSQAPSDRFPRFADYWKALAVKGVSTNIGSYVGSSEVYMRVRGPKPSPPTGAEMDRMRSLVREAMEDGALGVAGSLSGPPGAWIDTATMIAMVSEVKPYNGIESTHMRT